MQAIADIRKDYKLKSFNETDAAPDAMEQFTSWWNEALHSDIDEVNAMVLATATAGGMPDARVVLLKGYDERGFVFYTNYESHKGIELAENPRACLVFFWKELERQVRIRGKVTKSSGKDSDTYFFSRPAGSRIGAWASPQSSVIANREVLEKKVTAFETAFSDGHIPRPEHWGGYTVEPEVIEFWQGRSSRLHDRLQYTRKENGWLVVRLAP